MSVAALHRRQLPKLLKSVCASLLISLAGCGGGSEAMPASTQLKALSPGPSPSPSPKPGPAPGPISSGSSGTPSPYVPAAQAVNAKDDFLTIKEAEGVTTIDYPVQVGRVFLSGEIPDYPQALIDGKGVLTQADVKTRWPDHSVKHAILSFYIPTLKAGETRRVTFSNQSSAPRGGLSDTEMLASGFNFDSVMRISSEGKSASASARKMLAEHHATRWLSGPISTSVILADHSSARSYDLGFDSYRSLRPVFHATFWPRINKVSVRVIGETSNPDAWQTLTYDLTITGGATKATTIYSKPAVRQYPVTRWTRSFWIGEAPGKVDINQNLKYLAASGAVPNFNTALTVSEQTVRNWSAKWTAAKKDIFDGGNWEKAMGNGGGRPDIGIYPTWVVLWLYTGDHRLADMSFGNADLAGAWPMNFRESKENRPFVPGHDETAQGRPFSEFARPTFMLTGGNVNIRHPGIRPEDRVNFVGSEEKYGGWIGDGAHQPDPYSVAYMLTGDYWYLEQLQFWASWGTFHGVAAPNVDYSRGPQYSSGGIAGEDRAQAWVFRTRAHAAWLSPDASPEKAYLERQLNDAIAIFEGRHNVAKGHFATTPEWAWGLWASSEARKLYGDSRIGFWSPGLGAYADDERFAPSAALKGLATWQNGFVITALGRARELGYPTTPLLEWAAPFYNAITASDEERFAYLGAYTVPSVLSSSRRLATSWTEVIAAFKPNFNALEYFRNHTGDLDHGYSNIACAASTYVAYLPGGQASQSFCQREQKGRANFSTNPKWAILPR